MPTPPASAAVLLCFDGVLHDSDLPTQAFARHITEQLSAERIRPVIAGMRGFLEGRTELMPPDIDLSDAESGDQAVEILARAAGLDDASIRDARRASRRDLATSAWAVDPADGVDELLAALDGSARVVLLIEPGDPAARPVLESIGVTVDDIVDAPTAVGVTRTLLRMGAAADPDRLLLIGTSWTRELQTAHLRGCRTAQVDRYGRQRGTPTFRAPNLAGLTDGVVSWLRGNSTH